VLAGSIVALSLLFIAWAIGLGNVYADVPAVAGVSGVALAYPVGDIIHATVL